MDGSGSIEVELKFPAPDPDRIRDAVRVLGAAAGETIDQVDTYFAHPVRNFAETDEALRVRIVGETGCVTYKGPLLDAVTKSREETELWFAGGAEDARRFAAVLERLGFRSVRSVTKRREPWSLTERDWVVEIAIDDVDGLGIYVELETNASRESFEEAKACLLEFAKRLGLTVGERRSYLAMLLAADGHVK